jgi:hypothetical protein
MNWLSSDEFAGMTQATNSWGRAMNTTTIFQLTSPLRRNLTFSVMLLMTTGNTRNHTTYRTVCVALDGEAKHGDALVILTMVSQLSASSPIYAHLSPLRLMNH